MVFSEESSRAIFEMGNVELIELQKSSFNVHHVCITYLRVHLFAGAENWCDPEKTWWTGLKKPSKSWRHRTTTHTWLSQEVSDAVRTRGSNITTRLETHCEVPQKMQGHLPQSGTDGNMMKSTGKSQLSHNWSEELAKPAAAAARTAAAAVHFQHRRNKTLETEGDLGKPGRSARRLETHHRSGSSTWKQDEVHFWNGCGYSSRWQRSQHKCIPKRWSE